MSCVMENTNNINISIVSVTETVRVLCGDGSYFMAIAVSKAVNQDCIICHLLKMHTLV